MEQNATMVKSETSTTIQIRRGLEADLPTEAAQGEFLFCLDSHKLFSGMGPSEQIAEIAAGDATSIGGTPISPDPPSDGEVLIFDSASGEWVAADPVVSGPDAPGSSPTRPPVQIGIIDDSGKVQRASGSADGGINVNIRTSGGGPIPVTVSNFPATQPVSAAALPLPAGAATEASLGTDGTSPPVIAGTGIRGWLRAIYDKLVAGLTVSGVVAVSNLPSTQNVAVTNFPATQAVSAAALPLPAGAATEASLGTDGAIAPSIPGTGVRGWLRAIYDKLVAGLTVSGSVSVSNLPSTQNVAVTNFPATQPVSAAALPLPAGGSTSALQTTGNTSVASIDTKTPTVGQKAMAGSAPVVLASDQSAVPVSAAALPLPAGGSTSALQTAGNASMASLDSKLPTAGQKTMAGSQPVVLASDQPTIPNSAETGTVFNGTTALTPKYATIVVSAINATTVVAAVASKRIRVLAVFLNASGAVNAKWQSHVTPTDLTGLAYFGVNGGYVKPFNPVGWFQTAVGEALDLNLSAAVAVGGELVYVEV